MRRAGVGAAVVAGLGLCLGGCPKPKEPEGGATNIPGPLGDPKCKVVSSHTKPMIVEWPSADRGELEARIGRGAVLVDYDGCEMHVLSQCTVPGSYTFTAFAPKQDTVTIRNEDDLWAKIPMGAASFEGKLARYGELTIATTLVGRYSLPEPDIDPESLAGPCKGATHVLAAVTVGAFEFFAEESKEGGAGVEVMNAGVGGKVARAKQVFTKDGVRAACESAGGESGPPLQCSALIRLEVLPIGEATDEAPGCPDGSAWDGSRCVRTEVVAEVTCPEGATWDGKRCTTTKVDVTCPANSVWDGQKCMAVDPIPVCAAGKVWNGDKCVTETTSRGELATEEQREQVAGLVASAKKEAVSGNYAGARKKCDEALALSPNNVEALLVCAIAACNLKSKSAARKYADRLPESSTAAVRNVCLRNGVEL